MRTAVERTRVYTEERKLTYERVGHNLKCQSRERLVIGCVTNVLFLRSRDNTLNRGNIQRRRHKVNNRVQHILYTLVLIRRTAQNRNHLVCDGRLTDSLFDFILAEVTRIKEFFH